MGWSSAKVIQQQKRALTLWLSEATPSLRRNHVNMLSLCSNTQWLIRQTHSTGRSEVKISYRTVTLEPAQTRRCAQGQRGKGEDSPTQERRPDFVCLKDDPFNNWVTMSFSFSLYWSLKGCPDKQITDRDRQGTTITDNVRKWLKRGQKSATEQMETAGRGESRSADRRRENGNNDWVIRSQQFWGEGRRKCVCHSLFPVLDGTSLVQISYGVF